MDEGSVDGPPTLAKPEDWDGYAGIVLYVTTGNHAMRWWLRVDPELTEPLIFTQPLPPFLYGTVAKTRMAGTHGPEKSILNWRFDTATLMLATSWMRFPEAL